jgi:MYXO-CTERM domain-containing protein
VGTGLGAVLSFTTTAAPVVTTAAATVVTSSSATLNGSANPKLDAATGWYRYDTTNPGACDDSFGTRAPAAGGTSLGAGGSAVAYSQAITGLTSSTTYYFCAIASNAVGTGFGTVLSFTTAAAPTVTTAAATAVTSSAATLNGSANPNLLTATGWFRYSTTNPVTCNDVFGTRAPAAGGTALGAGGSAVAYAQSVAGLAAGTTYYYCAIASNAVGTGFGTVLSFTTSGPPVVTSVAATLVASTGATLNGSASPNLAAATGWFRYSTTNPVTCNDVFGTRAPAAGGTALGAGSTPVDYSQAITGLTTGATYYYCAIASNAAGTAFGAVLSFTTTATPAVTSAAATVVTSTGATLNGSANPKLDAATGWFRYSTTLPASCNDVFGTRAPAAGGTALGNGGAAVPYSQAIAGLTPGATYYFCAIASNGAGTGFGTVLSFTTTAAPVVTTVAASALTSTGATLNGSANPKLDTATGWFRYDTTDPGVCDDSFGARAPASGGTALGAGGSAVAYSQAITGLNAVTTYYYCAIAQNASGTSFGAVLSFTTLAAPSVTTVAASGVSGTAATLNGSANPNLAAATGWFRYSTTQPASCNDAFGTRAPAAGGTALGAGGSDVAYAQPVAGLATGTTYYYCAIASNAVGTGLGQVLSFTTPAAPSVTSVAASAVTSTGATFDGSANPNLDAATGWFRYSTTQPASCNDVFGTRAPAAGGTALGAGSSAVDYSQPITGLTPGSTYYFCAIASNALGKGFGAVLSFTTLAKPAVTSMAATAVTSTGATLNGSANPKLADATGWFRYDTTDPGACDDSFGTRAPASGGTSLGAGSSAVPYSEVLAGLAAGTKYYFCAIADNAVGTGFGAVLSFTTPAAPAVTTQAATTVLTTAALLNASANPNTAATTGWFRYDTTDPGACDDSFGTRAPMAGGTSLGSGGASVPYSQALMGLLPLTTYYYCAVAENAVGKSFGAVLSFTTLALPVVTTEDATDLMSSSATLNGSANPNGDASTAWFRYDTTDPGKCDDMFGTRAPASGGTSVGAGLSAVAFSEALADLVPGTTYYFCAIASNGAGTSFGEVLTLTTPAEAPTVMTLPATLVKAESAKLNGSGNPNGDAATGWFRYDTTNPVNCDDSFGVRVPATGGTDLGGDVDPVNFAQAISKLTPGMKYYYCAIASNSQGTSLGKLGFFVAGAAAPTVTTEKAADVVDSGATIAGTATPHGSATTGWFRYGDVDPGDCDDSFGTRVPETGGTKLGAGLDPAPYSEALSGLDPNATYYYCAAASNMAGAAFGEVLSFTTEAVPPVVTTVAAVAGSGGSTLNGTANPMGSETTVWFRYDADDPGECNDTFGTRAPSADGTALGDGREEAPFSEVVSNADPGTYYYCAIGSNDAGLGYGEVLKFEVPEEVDETPPGADGSCGCRVGSDQGGSVAAVSFVALFLLGLRRRRRQ